MIKEKEIWKDIKGYEGLYQISSWGRLKSLGNNKNRKEKIIKLQLHNYGYLQVRLSKNGKVKNFTVHQLTAIHFVPNPENLPEVNHLDGNKLNNYYKNLEWSTRLNNLQHAWKEGLIESDKLFKKIYCPELGKEFSSIKEASLQLNIDQSSISKCCRGKIKSCGKHPVTGKKLTWLYI